MIQRIQSLFLLLASGAAFGLLAFPFAHGSKTVAQSAIFGNDMVYGITDHVVLLILFCLAGGLSLLAIFMFNNRSLQIRLSQFSLIANIIGLILAVIIYMQDSPVLQQAGLQEDDGVGLYLPILFIVFIILAMRFIRKDAKLVSSMDRLR